MTANDAAWNVARADARLSPLARRFGDLVARHGDALVAASAAWLVERRASGHACLALSNAAGVAATPIGDGAAWPAFPVLSTWRAALRAAPCVGDGSAPSLLVLDAADRLYLHRDFRAEQRLASAIVARGGDAAANAAENAAPAADGDDQARAVAAAATRQFLVLTGGPGTGKTTTVVRVLEAWFARDPALRVALAAPTGKAAARLGEPVRPLRDRLHSVGTLHRLLGARPGADAFRFHVANPLPLDAVVVDEASMVDLTLMSALFDALPPACRVLLVGDHDQLASVEAGDVLGDVCRAELPGSVVRLRRNYRVADAKELVMAADALRSGDADAFLRVLEGGKGLRLVTPTNEAAVADLAGEWLDAFAATPTPEAALAVLERSRILCAHRRGPFGVHAVEDAIERRRRRVDPFAAAWPLRRPIVVTRNDPDSGLWNGDVGVVFADVGREAEGVAHFPATGARGAVSGLRSLASVRLPDHESAFATTVHKSQGSEFDRVILVLPPQPSPIVSRELLYTGVTRARREVVVVGSPEVIAGAVGRRVTRDSGLASAIRVAAGLVELVHKQP